MMMPDETPRWSAAEFLECRFDFPESGQWSELHEGRLVHFQPPDLDHGNAVLNLSKMLAEYAQSADGYACFDLGLLLQQNPDTVWCPAVSYFIEGRRFAELDRQVTDTVPALVIELASTQDRRRLMSERVRGYLHCGVKAVWVIDPAEQTLEATVSDHPDQPVVMSAHDRFDGGPILNGFHTSIGGLFTEPVWWS